MKGYFFRILENNKYYIGDPFHNQQNKIYRYRERNGVAAAVEIKNVEKRASPKK